MQIVVNWYPLLLALTVVLISPTLMPAQAQSPAPPGVASDAAGPADRPAPRTDENSLVAHPQRPKAAEEG